MTWQGLSSIDRLRDNEHCSQVIEMVFFVKTSDCFHGPAQMTIEVDTYGMLICSFDIHQAKDIVI